MIHALINNINSIPPLPESIQELERVYQDESSTFDDMRKVIEKDPLLTAEILRVANSSAFGVRQSVTSVKQAISLIGKDAVRSYALQSAVQSSYKIDLSPYGMGTEEFVLACERQLALCIFWLIRKSPEQLSVLAPAAFLVDIGRVIISNTLLDIDRASLLEEGLALGQNIDEAEKIACGAQASDVSASLFNHWGFDPTIIHIIRYSEDPQGAFGDDKEMAAILKVIRQSVLPNGEITDESIAHAKQIIQEFELDLDGYERAIERILS